MASVLLVPEHPSPVSPARAPPHPIRLTQPQACSLPFPRGCLASRVVPGQGASAQKAASETRVLLGQPSASLLPCGAEAWEDRPLCGRQPPLLPKPCHFWMEAESEHQKGQGCGRGPRPPRNAPGRAPGPHPTPSRSPATSARPPSPSAPGSQGQVSPIPTPWARPSSLPLPSAMARRPSTAPRAQGLLSSHPGSWLPGGPVEPQNLHVPGPRGLRWSHGLGRAPPKLCQGWRGGGTAVRLLAGLDGSPAP